MNDLALFTSDVVVDLQRHWPGLLRALLASSFTQIHPAVPLTDVQDQHFSFSLLIQLSRVKLGQFLGNTTNLCGICYKQAWHTLVFGLLF